MATQTIELKSGESVKVSGTVRLVQTGKHTQGKETVSTATIEVDGDVERPKSKGTK